MNTLGDMASFFWLAFIFFAILLGFIYLAVRLGAFAWFAAKEKMIKRLQNDSTGE